MRVRPDIWIDAVDNPKAVFVAYHVKLVVVPVTQRHRFVVGWLLAARGQA